MRRAMLEYRRIKRMAKIMEGKLSPEIINSFLEHVDQDVLAELCVNKADMKKLKRLKLREQLEILVPYFEKRIEKETLAKLTERLEMAERTAQSIAQESKNRFGKVILPFEHLMILTQLNPSPFIRIQGESEFVYSTAKLNQVLKNMIGSKIVWDSRAGKVIIMLKENGHRSIFNLCSQEPYMVGLRPVFTVRMIPPEPGFSITELIFKAAESLIGP